MEALGYVALRRNKNGHVIGIDVTDEGRVWAAEAS